jgi:hypothetical protein
MMPLPRIVLAGLVASCVAALPSLPSRLLGPATLRAQHAARADTGNADSNDDSDTDTTDNADNSDDHDSSTRVMVPDDAVRTLRIGRQFRPERDRGTPLHVNVEYGVGTFGIAPADGPWLYDVRLSYLPKRMTPTVHYDTASRTLRVETNSVDIGKSHNSAGGELHVGLARGVPLDAKVEFGAGEATMQLGGLSVRNLDIATGASNATIKWDSPNFEQLDHLDLAAGAAGVRVEGLGYAHARTITVKAGAGDVDLDFGGPWTGDATLDLTTALGAVHIHLPADVALSNASKTMIGSMEDNSPAPPPHGAPGAPIHHLRITGTATLSSVEIDRKVKE